MLNDFRDALRVLLHSPGYTLVAVITLALGIGVNSAIFTMADAMLWKPLPVPDLHRLMMIEENRSADPWGFNSVAPATFLDWKRRSSAFERMAGYQNGTANLGGYGGEPQRVNEFLVSEDFFETLGARAALGRTFEAAEQDPGRSRVVVLSHGLWQRRFGSDRRVVNSTMLLDGHAYTVIGVMGEDFDFPMSAELWTPMALTAAQKTQRTLRSVDVVARLKPGVSAEQAGAEMAAISASLAREFPEMKAWRAQVIGLREFMLNLSGPYSRMLLVGTAFVLLIACANVANLQLARVTRRAREFAVRTALGAARWRLIRLLMAESLLVSGAAAGLGLLLAWWAVDMMLAYMPPEVAVLVAGWKQVRMDGRVFLFTMAIAVLSGVISGVAPALMSSAANVSETLKEGSRAASAGRARHRLRGLFVTLEMALAMVLLAGAGLMVRGFVNLQRSEQMMQPATLLTMRVALAPAQYREPAQARRFFEQALERIGAVAGVKASAVATALPHSQHSSGRAYTVKDEAPPRSGEQATANFEAISPDYFRTMGIPLAAGRGFATQDNESAAPVAMVSERLARRWAGEGAIGKQIRIGNSSSWLTIVGVARDVRHNSYDRTPRAVVYVPFSQSPARMMDVAVRVAGDPEKLAAAVLAQFREMDRDQPVYQIATMEKLVHREAIGLNYVAANMGVLGMLALVLGVVGVYAVMSYVVSERTHEIGVRLALGAGEGDVLRMVMRMGLATTVAGVAIGLGGAIALARLLAGLVFGVAAGDPATFLGIALLLGVAALVATYVPARRAVRIDPVVALRCE